MRLPQSAPALQAAIVYGLAISARTALCVVLWEYCAHVPVQTGPDLHPPRGPCTRAARLNEPRAYVAFSAVRIQHLGQLVVDLLGIVELHPCPQQLHVRTLHLVTSRQTATAGALELLEIWARMFAGRLVCMSPELLVRLQESQKCRFQSKLHRQSSQS